MRQLLKTFFLLAPLVVGGLAFAQAPDDSKLPELQVTNVPEATVPTLTVYDVVDYLNNIRTLTADFVQITPDSVSRGRVSMSRPGKIRFEYTDETPILLVSDGQTVSLIDYDLGQVTKWPVKETPLALLLKDEISPDQVENTLDGNADTVQGVIHLREKDKEKPDVGELTLFFTGFPGGKGDQALVINGWEVVDPQGKLTTINLTNQKYDQPLDDSLWTFDDPRNERFQRRHRR